MKSSRPKLDSWKLYCIQPFGSYRNPNLELTVIYWPLPFFRIYSNLNLDGILRPSTFIPFHHHPLYVVLDLPLSLGWSINSPLRPFIFTSTPLWVKTEKSVWDCFREMWNHLGLKKDIKLLEPPVRLEQYAFKNRFFQKFFRMLFYTKNTTFEISLTQSSEIIWLNLACPFGIISENCRNECEILKKSIQDNYIWTLSWCITHQEFIEIIQI